MPRRQEDATDVDRFGGDDPAEMMCPNCKGIVIEDIEKCPHCGDWITPVDPEHGGSKRLIYAIAIVVMLLLALLMAF